MSSHAGFSVRGSVRDAAHASAGTSLRAQVDHASTASSVSEADGPQATIGTVTRAPVSQSALSLELERDNPSALLVPSQVVIPPGAATVSFPVAAVDNNLLDGPRSVQVRVWIKSGNFGSVDFYGKAPACLPAKEQAKLRLTKLK